MPTRQEQAFEHWRNDKTLRGVRKETPRAHKKEERVRRRDWLPEDLDDPGAWDEIDAPQMERVMPRGEAERRRKNEKRAQTRLIDAGDDTGSDNRAGIDAAGLAESVESAGRVWPADEIREPAAHATGTATGSGLETRPREYPGGSHAAPERTKGSALPTPTAQTLTPGRNGAGKPANSRPGLNRPGPANGSSSNGVEDRAKTRAMAPGYPERPGEGLVVEVSSGLCRVMTAGQTLLCTLRGSLMSADSGLTNLVAVGDRVRVTADGAGRGVIEAVLPRRSVLARPDVLRSHLRQVIAANADQLLVVASWRDPAFWPELVDRYLVTASLNGLQPIIGVNKIDLATELAEARAALRPYTALGYPVIFTSAVTGQGVAELRAALANHMTALAGLSGVGKSSLLGAVQPGLNLRTSEVSDHWHQGRPITTQAVVHRLQDGGSVVDTPGIREFGLAGLRRHELAAYYPELAAEAGACRFADCTHRAEPGCGVQSALRQGRISTVRYESYQKIRAGLPA